MKKKIKKIRDRFKINVLSSKFRKFWWKWVSTLIGLQTIVLGVADTCKSKIPYNRILGNGIIRDVVKYIFDKENTYIISLILFLLATIFTISYAYFLTKIEFNFGEDKIIEIKFGDIFEEKELKVIPANEYFDTLVDNIVIAKKTLHGKVVDKLTTEGVSINELDTEIESRLHGIESIENQLRTSGKKLKYPIGTTIEVQNDYILTAFSKFDDTHRVIKKSGVDYLNFLMKFWDELDCIKNDRNISIPFIGTGNANVATGQIHYLDIIHMILITFKTSKINFSQNTKATLVIHSSMKDKISLLEIKKTFNKGE